MSKLKCLEFDGKNCHLSLFSVKSWQNIPFSRFYRDLLTIILIWMGYRNALSAIQFELSIIEIFCYKPVDFISANNPSNKVRSNLVRVGLFHKNKFSIDQNFNDAFWFISLAQCIWRSWSISFRSRRYVNWIVVTTKCLKMMCFMMN